MALRTDVFRKPPRVKGAAGFGKHLAQIWDIAAWRRTGHGGAYPPHPPIPGEALYLASLCYADAHNAVADWQLRYKLPLSPVLQSLIMFADKEGVAREGLVLAILLEHSAASFKPAMVAPAWAAVQCRNTGSAH